MMGLEDTPIQFFIAQRFSTPAVQRLIEGWRVEPADIVEKLVEHFREMGIFKVTAGHEALITKTILFQLKNSPEISKLVQRAKMDEMKRQRNRHSE